jgi:predicted SprT family Zn-dependent metalloprotease
MSLIFPNPFPWLEGELLCMNCEEKSKEFFEVRIKLERMEHGKTLFVCEKCKDKLIEDNSASEVL